MRFFYRLRLSLIAGSLASSFSLSAQAQDYDMDCKVILCLAGGFPSGCGDAKSYMMNRLKKFKPPFGVCSRTDGGADYTVPTQMFTREVPLTCSRYVTVRGGGDQGVYQSCQGFKGGYTSYLIRITIPDENGEDYSNEYEWNRVSHSTNGRGASRHGDGGADNH